MNKFSARITFIYGLALIALGSIGYLKSASAVSLYTGSIFGLIILASGFSIIKNQQRGLYTALFTSALLTAVFSIRYLNSGKLLPAILGVLSGSMFLFYCFNFRNSCRCRN